MGTSPQTQPAAGYSSQTRTGRPGRPFGLTLAILTTAMIFSVIPLVRVGGLLVILSRFNSFDWNFDIGDQEMNPIASGGDIGSGLSTQLVIETVLGVSFLVVAILAWRGRPAWVRYVLFWGVLALNAVNLLLTLPGLLQAPAIEQGITSGDDVGRVAQLGYLGLMLLVSLYLIWYMNRAPARAFYRGYYLPEPSSTEHK